MDRQSDRSCRPEPRASGVRRNRWPMPVIAAGLLLAALPGVASAAVMTYDRAKAVAYAAANYNKVVSDGYFWIDSGTCRFYGAGHAAPTGGDLASGVGDDCAHFVSSCIGTPSGAGIAVHQPFANSSNASYRAQYGDPSAGGLASWLVSSGDAVYKNSISGLVAGDVIAYDWNGNGIIDHIVFYMGNGLISAHATSHLNIAYNWAAGSNPNEILTYVHITVPNAPTPEPTTLAGLMIAGAMLTRRRRIV